MWKIHASATTVRHSSDWHHSTSTQTKVCVVIIVTETEVYRFTLTMPFRVQNSNHLKGVQKNTNGRVVSNGTKERQLMYAFVGQKWLGKGKVHPITGHEGPEGE